MTQAKIIERLDQVERELSSLKKKLEGAAPVNTWRETAGWFADDPLFEKAVRFGRAYRQSLRPKPLKVSKKK